MNRATPTLKTLKDLQLLLRLTPGSCSNETFAVETGSMGPHFKAPRALRQKGKTNAALSERVAKWLQFPKSAMMLKSDGQFRIKTIEFGTDSGDLYTRLQSQYEDMSY